MSKSTEQPADVIVRPAARLLSKGEMLDKVGVTYPTIWKLMRDGAFPRPS
jgi:predicted DNA-binding transcriptional regulator AlpA